MSSWRQAEASRRPLRQRVSKTLSVWLLATASFAIAKDATPSPTADADHVCPSGDLAPCYPRLFHATDEFQVVREGQELPPGLHVRLNIWSGQKEAKLYSPDDADAASPDGSSIDSSVIVVAPELDQEPGPAPNTPMHAEDGHIKAPGVESPSFRHALGVLREWRLGQKATGSDLDDALDTLEDLSHDMYYGLKTAEDAESVKSLFCLMSTGLDDLEAVNEAAVQWARMAAQIIAATVQNNPKALGVIEGNWVYLMQALSCPGQSNQGANQHNIFNPMSARSLAQGDVQGQPRLVKARISAINGLIKSPLIRSAFLEAGGLASLLRVFRKGGGDESEWQPAHRRTAELLQDNFLDEDMAAPPGAWARAVGMSIQSCQASRPDTQEACAETYVHDLAEKYGAGGGHWTMQLLEAMKRRRLSSSKDEERTSRDEL